MKDILKFVRKDLQKEIKEIKDPMQDLSEDEKLKLILNNTKIDLKNKKYEKPLSYLEIRADSGYTTVFSPSNISAITGKAKARKSFIQSMIIASTVKNGNIDGTINSNLPKGKENIILFDTEQSEYHVSLVAKRINKLIEYDASNLYVYSLRGLDAETIINLINYVVENIENLGMIFIDQVADLTKSINSEEEAVKIVKLLERVSKEKELHICCVIHQNKGDNFASGWLGSQIMKKAETVISVSKDEDKSLVKADLTRNKEFKDFEFSINEFGIPYILYSDSKNDPDNNNYNINAHIEPTKEPQKDIFDNTEFKEADAPF